MKSCVRKIILMVTKLINYNAMYGQLEIDINGRIKCEICGEYFNSVCAHANKKHKISAREYKLRYGLKLTKPVSSSNLTDKLSNAALNRNTEYLIEAGKQYRYKKGESGRKFCSEQEKIEIRKRLDKFKFKKK